MISRRNFILSGTAAAAAAGASFVWPSNTGGLAAVERADGRLGLQLTAETATAPLLGEGREDVQIWGYNGELPGPTIRARQGERLRVTLANALDEETTIHWHGVRVPNAMDGVPHLTQDPVKPGSSFTYEFDLHDAGTFWYHPHQRSFEQVARGLYGPLIVEERHPVVVDRDLTWVLDDWRIGSEGQITGGFGSRHDATMAGRIGNTITINGRLPQPLTVRAGERIRLRLINAANARLFALDFRGHSPKVIAIDGQPVTPHQPDGPVLLGPAMRMDLILDMSGEPGARSPIVDTFYSGLEYPLTEIAYAKARLRERPLDQPIALPPNLLGEPQLAGAARHDILFGGGMMGMMSGGMGSGMMGGGGMGMMGWSVNGTSPAGHVHEPLFSIERGRTAVFALKNDTAWWHPIHVHGHSFRVISRNGKPTARREWQDTVLIPPQESAEVAFVADNPGDWMLHCHILEHQAAGMMAAFKVA